MRRIKTLSCLFLGFVGFFAHMIPAQAQFIGFSADAALGYSATEEHLSGGSFGITHPIPFIPNLGAMGFFYERRKKGSRETTLATKVRATTANFYYHIPVPVFSLSAGLGAGTLVTKTDIIQQFGRVDTVEVTSPITEGFVRFGLPFIHFFDFHIGYHFVSTGAINLVKGSDTEITGIRTKINFSGGLTTIGILIAL